VRGVRLALAGLIAGLVVFVVVTLLALEGNEVVVLRTFDAQGGARETRTWIATDGGYEWIEAANPERPFLADIRATWRVDLQRGGVIQHCEAAVVPNPNGHEHIRRLLAAKYGWADAWIGTLTDTSGSLALRLHCG
jgi:hypothetical protein